MSKTIFAHTPPSGEAGYVPYVNLSEDQHGVATLTVRPRSLHGGGEASIEMRDEELERLARDIDAHLAAKHEIRERERKAAAVLDLESDAPLANACDLSGEGSCESCQ